MDNAGMIIVGIVFLIPYAIVGIAQFESDADHWNERIATHGNPWGLPWPHRPLQYLFRASTPGYWFAIVVLGFMYGLGRVNDWLQLW